MTTLSQCNHCRRLRDYDEPMLSLEVKFTSEDTTFARQGDTIDLCSHCEYEFARWLRKPKSNLVVFKGGMTA